MSETQFNVDCNTNELVEYLEEEFGTKVISYIRKNEIDGKAFLSLTRDRLKDSELPDKFHRALLDKVAEAMRSLPSTKCGSKTPEAMEVAKPAVRKVLHIIFQTILPAHLWGWIGGEVCVQFTEFKMRQPLQILSEPTPSGYILFDGKVSVPIDTIKKYKCCLLYKYQVSSLLLSNSQLCREDLPFFDGAICRVLKIPESCLYPETTFRQYDVPIYPKEKIINEVEHRLDAVEKHLKDTFPEKSYTLEPKLPTTDCEMRNLSLKLHLRKFECELMKCSFEFNSSLIKQLYDKIKLVYKQIDGITVQVEFFSRNKSFDADGNFKECLCDWTVDLAKKLESKSLSNPQCIIPGAVLCLLLSCFDLIENLRQDTLKLIMKLLYLKPDEEGSSTYRNLLKCLSNDDLKKELHISVERLCCQFIKLIQGKSIDWLRNTPLPLYHFLKGISKPFVPIEMSLKMKWTFWRTISDNKRSFHKYLLGQNCRFQDICLSLKDLTKFDPVLMKVVLYLCPEDDLHTIIPLTPPFLVTSYLIHIYNEKGIKENEAILLNFCIKNLEVSLSQLEKEEWRANGDKLYQISEKLIEIVFKKIQSIEKHHQTVLVVIINYYLYLVSKMYENEEEPDTTSHMDKMLNMLSSWFNHHNVIGGSSFGGTAIKQQKVKEELQIWISLNECVKCPECISDLWTNQLKAILEGRTEQVSSNKSKVAIFLEVVKHENCPEVIVDIFIVTALNGLASLKGNEAQDAVATLMKQNKDVAKIGRLLSQFIMKRHCPSVGTELTTAELLNWEVWPNFIELSVQNDPVIAEMNRESVALIKWAHQKIIDVESSLKDGSITLHELNQYVKEKEKTQRLLKAASISTVNICSFETVIVTLKEYVDVVSTLFHSLRPCFKGYEKMKEDLSRDRNSLAMNVICPTWATGDHCSFVLSSELRKDSALMQNKDTFYVMIKCEIFRKMWWTYQEKLSDDKLSQQQFVDQVWTPAINDSLSLISACYDGSAIVSDIVIYFPSFDQETIQDYLMALQKALSNCSSKYSARIPSKNTWIRHVSKKISTYQRFRHYQETAAYLLKLKDCLQWSGNFHLLESIAEQNTYISTLNDVNEYVLSTCDKLKVVSDDDKKNCLLCLVGSWEIVQWIAQGFTDLPDLQTFIDVAYTSGTIADDDLNIKKLNALRYVGNSVANFIPVLKNNSQSTQQSLGSGGDNDQSMKLIQLCHNLWIFLERNKELPSLIKDCTRNLQWFKNIKGTHGAVEVNTLEELRIILAEGEFFLGSELKEACYQISDVIYLQVNSGSFIKQYDLEQLQDLESRLVLFAGQSAEVSDVQRFLNVFHTVCIIADMLIKLHELGCVQYIGWQRNFSFSQSKLTLLEKDQRYMSQQLSRWSEAVDAARNQYHVLNSFTMKQLLHLRKELHPVFSDEDISFSVTKQTRALLQCLHPCIDPQDMNDILKEAWKQSDCHINDVRETSIINAGDSFSIECEALDITVDELEKELSDDQRVVYVELTEINGLDPLWSIAEIISRKQNPTAIMTNDILKHFASLEDQDQKPNKDDLMKIITSNREVQVEPTSAHKITSDVAKGDSTIADPKHLEMIDLEIHGYLSLTKLMHVLTNYNINAHQKIELIPRNRHLSAIDFYPGFPNLYVTSSAEILQTVLMIYSKDKTMPLPTQEEVLLCNEKTTAEEVILLWRRAIFDPGHKRIFCLVHGEKLSYSTCEESLRELNRLKQGKKGYRLVLLCSNEDSLHFITALHSYKRSNPNISGAILEDYLLHYLIKPKHTSIGTISSAIQASSVDPHCSYVRIVQSKNPGNGKSLYIQRLGEKLMNSLNIEIPIIRIPIHGPDVPYNNILNKLSDLTQDDAKIIHFDIAATMLKKVESFLFYVLVLGYLKDLKGNTWRRRISQMYTIEVTLTDPKNHEATYNLLHLFPKALCLSPSNCRYINKFNAYDENTGMDEKKLQSNEYQRVYQYLSRYHSNENLDSYFFNKCDVMKNPKRFIQVILNSASRLKSWSEFESFVKFLNVQLQAVEKSIFCVALGSGFKSFVIKMMIEMSKEFTASSNSVSPLSSHPWDESCHPYLFFNKDQTTFTFIGFCISKDCHAIDPRTGSLILANVMSNQLRQLLNDQRLDMTENYYKWNKDVLLQKLATVIGLKDYYDPDPSYVITVDNIMKMMAILMRFRSGIPVVIMGETGCGKTRLLKYLCKIASQDDEHENDTDSCIVVLKVHGGTTSDDIEKAVKKAEDLAEKTRLRRIVACDSKESLPVFGTVLFFDEANTSEHINLIKEIMCDGSVLGRKIHQDLRVVAACNPYRKHSKVMITKLESAGLGFSTKSSQASHVLEQIPLRQLVYRVNELPLSMKSLIFDFGGIQRSAEQQYIRQIVENKIQHSLKKYVDSISDVLSWSQNYMRDKENECSFVSLRDVDRAVTVFIFFHELLNGALTKEINQKVKNHEPIENKVTRALIFTLGVCYHARLESREEFEEKVLPVFKKPIHVKQSNGSVFRDEIKCCQEVFLDNMKLGKNIARNNALRENVFMMVVCISLRIPLFLVGKPGSSKSLAKSVILNSLKGPNSESEFLKTLKEVQLFSYQCSQLSTSESILKLFSQASNVQSTWDKSKYVAVVVLDEVGLAEDSPSLPLKVLHPLLEDGTEGNSYSVDEVIDQEERVGFIGISNWALDPAKMNRGIMIIRGDPSQEELEQSALQICSEEGMDKTIVESLKLYFKSFAEAYQNVLKEQKKMREFFGLRDFYSLVKMLFWMCKAAKQVPNEKQIQHVILRNFSGFPIDAEIDIIELFNKKLCPSPLPDKNESRKKCRGFLKEEFKETMFDIVSENLFHDFKNMLAKEQEEQILTSQDVPDHQKIEFSNCYHKGDFKYPEINEKFEKMIDDYCNKRFDNELWPFIINPDNSASGLVVSSLFNKERTMHGESRYLLFLTENYSALQTLQHFLRDSSLKQDKPPYVLFGSSFPKDKDFTQVYRNINNIKVCMETGRTVVLLNLDHLYESLYDALNQYYVYFGNMRFVDLGLQNHRVKCHVHDNFKLILIAEKKKVYQEFPTALINRLEKHFVVTSTILTEEQLSIEQKLNEWVQKFCTEGFNKKFEPSDSFIGFQNDTPAAVVFKASRMIEKIDSKEQLDKCKFLLLEIATPDALVRLKQSENIDENEFQKIASIYIHEQHHQSLKEFLLYHIDKSSDRQGCRMQVTTCNDLLSEEEVGDIRKTLNLKGSIDVCILQEFDTEFEFSRKIRESFQNNTSLLIIQCDSGHLNSDLLACAKYRVDDIFTDMNTGAFNSNFEAERQASCHILFTVLIPRENSKSSFVSFLGGDWICSHIDDFSPECNYCPVSLALSNTPLSLLFHNPDKDSLHCGTIDHCRFLYKNITEAISFLLPNSKFEGRSHDLNNILYRLLMISPSVSCNDDLSEIKSSASAFYNETVKCIFEQLKRNESVHKDWVTKVALQPAELQKGGAFVKVLLRSLDKIVNEILAQIISFTDRNYNLELIDPSNSSIPLCVKKFWILAFSKLVANHLASSPYKFGNEIYDYHSKFPFSKEIQCGIDAILNFQGQNSDSSSSIPDHLLLTFDLLSNIDIASFDEMKERYIYDLIQIKWCHTYRNDKINKRILDIISNTIIESLAQHNWSGSVKFFDVLKNVHQVFDNKKKEISSFKEMIFFFPRTLDKLLLKKKLPLNVLAAIAALEVLDDDHQFLRGSPAAAVSKLHQFYQVSNLIDTALYSYELKSGSEGSSDDRDLIVVSRLKWHGLQVLHLFMEHVVKDHMQYFDKLLQFTNRIRMTFVSNPCDFTKKDTIRTLEQYLSQMYKEFTSTHSQAADNFSQNCINFYVAVISDICMKYDPPEDELIDKLIETVFSVSSEDKTIAQTRELTPFLKQEKFNDSVPVVRSFILQILLDHNYHNVRKHIEKYMAEAQNLGTESDGFLNSLKLTYCQLHENSLYGSVISMKIIQDMLTENENTLIGVDDTAFSLQNIETIACTRFVLTHICEFLVTKLDEVLENHELCSSVERICKRSDVNSKTAGPKLFLLKILYRRCGEMGIQKLLCKPSLSWILPERIFGHDKSVHLMDYFSLYDSKYCRVRQLLIDITSNKGDLKQTLDSLQDEISTSPFLFTLAIFMEVTLTFSKTNVALSVNVMQELRKFSRKQACLHNLQELTIALIDNQFCAQGAVEQLFVQPERSPEDLNFTAVVVHIATGIISRKDCNLLSFFYDIISDPEQLKSIYIPAMPEDFVEQARRIFRGQFYVCPNGHSYMVTECGSPVEEKFCSGCQKMGIKTTIGGLNHNLRKDNKIRGEPIQTGYLLGTPILSPAIPERSLSPTACTIVKILLHSTLLWTCCSKSHLIKSIHQIMTHDDVPPDSLPKFFWQHLLMNFESLCGALSIGLDDAILLIHIIMVRITMDKNEFSVNKLLTSENRQKWEKDFNSAYIQPVLKDMHKIITISREQIMKDDHSNHPKLLDFVYERNIQNPSMIHHLWKYRPAVTLEHLSQQIDARELTNTYPALSFFLREEVCLRATKYLPAIAELQGFLYSIHHYRSSREELLKLTIRDFLNDTQAEERETLVQLIEELRQAWNLVRGRLQSQKLLHDECIGTTFLDDTTLIHLLPRSDCCTTALVNFLVTIHNQFVDICLKLTREMHSFAKTWRSYRGDRRVDLKNLHKSQLLNYDDKLKAVILRNCHYSLTVGNSQTDVEYNFAALEKQLLNEFVYGKPLIRNDICFAEYRKDVYTGEKFDKIEKKVKPTILLPDDAKNELASKLNSIRHLREALDHLEIVMGFLAAGGEENGNMLIAKYAELLNIKSFNTTIGGHCLGQIQSLWKVVSLNLAIELTITNEASFSVLPCFCKPIGIEELEALDEKLQQVNLDGVLSALNEFIEVHVRNAQENESNWKIGECIEGYFGEYPENLKQDFEVIETISMEHIIAVWEKLVTYQRHHKTSTA